MNSFTDSATNFIDECVDGAARQRAWRRFELVGLPTTGDEVWRYAPLGDLAIEHFEVPRGPAASAESPLARELSERAERVVRLVDGFAVSLGEDTPGVTVSLAPGRESLSGEPLEDRYQNDAFALMNLALAPAAVVIRVAAATSLERPLVVLNESRASACFSRTQIIVERAAEVTVVEYFDGGDQALVVPLSEYLLEEGASLRLVTYQRLADSTWHVARTTGFLARDGRLTQAVVGLGAHYNRSRNDAELLGAGSANELRTTYLGSGDQVHDFRTRQYHVAPRTTSTLLSKGAVADRARSVYTGLIEIEKGAKRTDARQTNHNLLLSPRAHADSVPNLDIRENDVMCAHASSVGPLDELQRWYLESRGVSPDDAQRLLIQGFFYEMLAALPGEMAPLVERDVESVLATVIAGSS